MRMIDGGAPQFTFSDLHIVPQENDIASRSLVDLTPPEPTGMTIPIVVANMNAVAGRRMAETVARRGGLTVFPQDLSLDDVAKKVTHVKTASPRFDSPTWTHPNTPVYDAKKLLLKRAHDALLVTNAEKTEPLGLVTSSDFERRSEDEIMADIMKTEIVTLPNTLTPKEMFEALKNRRIHYAPVLDENGQLEGVVTAESALRMHRYKPAVDAGGRLLTAAAVGINGNPARRAQELVDIGVDVLVVDTAHGHQVSALRAVGRVREQVGENVVVVAGNVVTAAGTTALLRAGATIVKVGVGPGAMCTTRMMTGVGRPQFSAIRECAEAANQLGGYVWGDGGIKHPRDLALAMAAGASSVMIGSLFAPTFEAAAPMEFDAEGRAFKSNHGMASGHAVKKRNRGIADEWDRRLSAYYEEGISKSTLYVDLKNGGVEVKIDQLCAGFSSAMTYSGAKNIREYWHKVVVGVQTSSGYEEGKPAPNGW